VGRGTLRHGDSALVWKLNIPAIRECPLEPYEQLTTAGNGSARRIALYTIGEAWSLPG